MTQILKIMTEMHHVMTEIKELMSTNDTKFDGLKMPKEAHMVKKECINESDKKGEMII